MPLDRSKRAKYIKNGGTICPFCGSTQISADSCADIDGGRATQEITCAECDGAWVDQYTLTGIKVIREPVSLPEDMPQ